jgi:hypothetical protein
VMLKREGDASAAVAIEVRRIGTASAASTAVERQARFVTTHLVALGAAPARRHPVPGIARDT